MSEEIEAQNTAPTEIPEWDTSELDKAELRDCRAMLFASMQIGLDETTCPEYTNMSLWNLVREYEDIIREIQYEEIIPFIEKIPRSDLRLIFYSNTLYLLPLYTSEDFKNPSNRPLDQKWYRLILEQLISNLKINNNYFQNIEIINSIPNYSDHLKRGPRYKKECQNLLKTNMNKLSDPNLPILNYELLDPFLLDNPVIVKKIFSDLSNPEKKLSRAEQQNIIFAFSVFPRFASTELNDLPEVEFNNLDIFQIIQLIDKKSEALAERERSLVRVDNLLLASDIGEHQYFYQKIFSYYEEIEDVIETIPLEDRYRLLKVFQELGGSCDYLANSVLNTMYDGREAHQSSNKYGFLVEAGVMEEGAYEGCLLARLISGNNYARDQLILSSKREERPRTFDRTAKAIIDWSEDLDEYLGHVLSEAVMPIDVKYSILMKFASRYYKDGCIKSFESICNKLKYLFREYNYRISVSPITMYAYTTFLRDLSFLRAVKAGINDDPELGIFSNRDKREIRSVSVNTEENTKLCILGKGTGEYFLKEFATILEEHYPKLKREMSLVEKAFYFHDLDTVLIEFDIEEVNTKIIKILKEEMFSYMSYYRAQEYGSFNDSDDTEDLSMLFGDLVNLVFFNEIKNFIYELDSNNKKLLSKFEFPILKTKPFVRGHFGKFLAPPKTIHLIDEYAKFFVEKAPKILFIPGYIDPAAATLSWSLNRNLFLYLNSIRFDRMLEEWILKRILMIKSEIMKSE